MKNRIHWVLPTLVLIFITAVISACSSFFVEPVLTLPVPLTDTPRVETRITPTQLTRTSIYLVQVSATIGQTMTSAPEIDAGTSFEFHLTFAPSEIQIFSDASGKTAYTSTQAWKDHPIREMQFCLSLSKACEIPGKWDPFQPSFTQTFTVDWVGPRNYYIVATFRNGNGTVIPSVHSGYGYNAAKDITRYQNIITSVINTATPIAQQPPFVRTAFAATQKAFPVTGSVQIEGGRGAAGGTAGSQITLKVQLSAASPAGKVTQMRVQPTTNCRQTALTAAWEPFAPEKSFTTTLALNWVGFYVSAQFKDEKGNLSPIYCDDISLEGNPVRTP